MRNSSQNSEGNGAGIDVGFLPQLNRFLPPANQAPHREPSSTPNPADTSLDLLAAPTPSADSHSWFKAGIEGLCGNGRQNRLLLLLNQSNDILISCHRSAALSRLSQSLASPEFNKEPQPLRIADRR